MRWWSLAMLCGVASCGWIAGLGSYSGRSEDATPVGPADADADAADAGTECTTDFASGGVCPTSLTAGVGSTCVVAPDGLYCWGQNIVNSNAASAKPILVDVGSDKLQSVRFSSSEDPDGEMNISVGCYLTIAGGLACWGDSVFGQVQEVKPQEMNATMMTPVGISKYAVGADHVCAYGGSNVLCWGRSDLDQLNVATASGPCSSGDNCSITPVDTKNVQAIGAFVAGQAHTCVSANATPSFPTGCWGDNASYQLGTNTEDPFDMLGEVLGPDGAVSLGSASELALGAAHTCAIVGTATYCWGANNYGQLGASGVSGISMTPVEVTTAASFAHIAAGTNNTCAIDQAGGVWCWGDNERGQAGQGSGSGVMPTTVDQPTQVPAIANATMIAVGDLHACAALADGDIMCWGDNSFGELGDGVTMHAGATCSGGDCSPTPVLVTK
jgi:alpha-tubulin suppressor-like RCC1 family protein